MSQNLANTLNVDVMAPTKSVCANPDGSYVHDFRLDAPVDAGITFFRCIKEAKEKSEVGAWSFK